MKYGFVYIWRDRKHKRFYIGSHWGSEDDGYICSSFWMKRAYKLRPNDFKRRILERNIKRKLLNETEHKWLQMIKNEELGKRYYNIRNHRFGHWSHLDSTKTITEKQRISYQQTIWAMTPEERSEKLGYWKGKSKPLSEETKRKIGLANAKTLKEKASKMTEKERMEMFGHWKGKPSPNKGKKMSEESRAKMSKAKKGKAPWNKGKTGLQVAWNKGITKIKQEII